MMAHKDRNTEITWSLEEDQLISDVSCDAAPEGRASCDKKRQETAPRVPLAAETRCVFDGLRWRQQSGQCHQG
eukprot:EW709226.1.p3 GENE.EW709226.1~~EW709226.1.p3  ORF type:complete len:73 (+),score=9.68 EW709226.1:99-317(+)